MWSDDPVRDWDDYCEERERKHLEWMEERGIRCAICDELIGDREYIDLSGSNEEGCTFHTECFDSWLDDPEPGAVTEALKNLIFDEYRRKS